jgi:hypothetical protein
MILRIRKIFVVVSCILSLTISGIAVWYLGNIAARQSPGFTAYYSALTVTGFDAAGNAQGYRDVYRVDGMSAAPIKIYTDPAIVPYGSQIDFSTAKLILTSTTLKEDETTIVQDPVSLITKVDRNGRAVSVQASDKPSDASTPFLRTSTTPNGTYTLTTDLVCTEIVDEGPCPMDFTLRVHNTKTFETTTLSQKDFGLENVRPLKIDVLGYVSDTVALVQMNSQQELYLQVLGTLNVSTRTFTELQRNFTNLVDAAGPTYTFQWLEADRQHAIMLKRDMAAQNSTWQYVRFDFVNKAFDAVTPALQYYPDVLEKNLQGYYFQKDYASGEWYYDFASSTERQITIRGSIQNFSPELRFVPLTVYATNNGLGPQRVIIQDLQKNTTRQLFDQVVGVRRERSGSTETEENQADIGSIIYTFIGLEQ